MWKGSRRKRVLFLHSELTSSIMLVAQEYFIVVSCAALDSTVSIMQRTYCIRSKGQQSSSIDFLSWPQCIWMLLLLLAQPVPALEEGSTTATPCRSFQPGDTVIQSRCSKDTVLMHEEYGPVAFSFYANIKPATKNIVIVADPGITLPLCAAIRAAKLRWLRTKFPNSTVQVVGGTLEQDFMRLMFAPVLFKDAQSSLGLWAALANKGDVWSVPLLAKYTNRTTPNFGSAWHWVDAPVLYPHVAKEASITRDDTAAIIQWLERH